MSDVSRDTSPDDARLDQYGEPLPTPRPSHTAADGEAPLTDLLKRYGPPTPADPAKSLSSSSSSDPSPPHWLTDGEGSDRQPESQSVRETEGRGGEGVRSPVEEEEKRPQNAPQNPSVKGAYPDMVHCDHCGPVEAPHDCPKASAYDVPVPNELEELIVYLHTVWDIRFAEIVALESGSEAVRWAVQIVKRGRANGEVYTDPAGLIVKLARRLARAARRPR